jgi:hypothetical protein
MFHTVCGFSSGLFLPYFIPMAIAMLEMAPQSKPFKEMPAPKPILLIVVKSVDDFQCEILLRGLVEL